MSNLSNMNNSKRNALLIFAPSCLWAYAGSKLLLMSAKSFGGLHLSIPKLLIAASVAWIFTSIKYHVVFKKNVSIQLDLSKQLLENKISKSCYMKKTFLSKKFFIPILMMVLSLTLRKYVGNSYIFLILRLAIGYSLLRTAFSYSLSSRRLLAGNYAQS